ncbi:MAG: tail fiber protein [Flavobacteriales bacterium]|nr:tail fiber protein [Flavobacteriales bacterium]
MFKIIFRVSFLLFAFVAIAELASAQNDNVGIGTITPAPAAILDVANPGADISGVPAKGILIPSVTLLQRDPMEGQYNDSLPDGLLTYEPDGGDFWYYKHDNPTPTTAPFGDWVMLSTGNQNNSSNFPPGGIIMWSGTIASIPVGWALCDGSNGTPDLTDRFLISVASSAENPQPSEINAPNDFVNIDVSDANNRRFYKIAYIIKLP